MARDTWVPFEGAPNFRDIGGVVTRPRGRVRRGLVFRSGGLDALTPGDRERYEQLGVRTVIDLRALSGQLPRGKMPRTAADGERRLREVYRGLLDHAAPAIGDVLAALANPDALPAVLHCEAGKDRTGITVALLLELLGVDRELVLDDYQLSERHVVRPTEHATYERLVANGYPEEAAAALLATSRPAMAGALDHLDQRYGGIELYLVGPGGLKRAHLDRLRDELIEPGPTPT